MTDVRDAAAPALQENAGEPRGDFIWYELMTTDPDGAKAFYDALIGWDVEPKPTGEQPMDYRMIRRSDGGNAGGVLRIDADMAAHGAKPTWLGYIVVPDVDATTAAIEQAGGKTLMATDIQGVGRIAMVTDPQGAPFYVMKPNPPERDPNAKSDVFDAKAEQRVGWNELSTTDPVAARRFYEEQFGWGTDDFMDMGEMGQYRFIDQGGERIGALCGVMPGGQPAWRFYFRVPSIAKAKDVVTARGGTVRMGPMQVPTGDYIIIGSDPQGAEFALVGGI